MMQLGPLPVRPPLLLAASPCGNSCSAVMLVTTPPPLAPHATAARASPYGNNVAQFRF
eukprot:NODE_30089_length_427_cov_4.983333.p2 GENE.NODE_30089_length_427_cov_4.983333~~NODE_30089_length_427_cov_4.983333.p2  ORF type:complete len:58 (-),score=3.28 NODE_30089_length_427_cov_4.983333:55-228(-)